MKILVTGAGGFIGSRLVEVLLSQGYAVRAFVHYNSRNTWGWLEEVKKTTSLEIMAGDLRDYDMVSHAMKGCQQAFHLGALIGIPYSYVSPLAYIKTNVEGAYNVLQAAQENGGVRVIHTSTSETYGTAQYVPMDENHPINPQSPYAATKASADLLALSYHRSFGLPVTVVRPFNTYGPRQSARAIIPTVIGQMLEGKHTLMLGSLEPTRDLTYVDDTVSGFIAAANSDKTLGETVNLGTAREISIGNIVKLLANITGWQGSVEQDPARVRPVASEVERLLSSPEKMHGLTGWKAKISLEKGLERTVEWIRSNLGLYKNHMYNV